MAKHRTALLYCCAVPSFTRLYAQVSPAIPAPTTTTSAEVSSLRGGYFCVMPCRFQAVWARPGTCRREGSTVVWGCGSSQGWLGGNAPWRCLVVPALLLASGLVAGGRAGSGTGSALIVAPSGQPPGLPTIERLTGLIDPDCNMGSEGVLKAWIVEQQGLLLKAVVWSASWGVSHAHSSHAVLCCAGVELGQGRGPLHRHLPTRTCSCRAIWARRFLKQHPKCHGELASCCVACSLPHRTPLIHVFIKVRVSAALKSCCCVKFNASYGGLVWRNTQTDGTELAAFRWCLPCIRGE